MTDKHQFNMQQWKLGIVYRDELVFRSDGSMFYWTSGFPLQAINVQIIDMLSVRSKVYDWMWCMRHQGTHIDCYIQSDVSFIRRGQLNFHNFVERSLHPTSCLWMFFFLSLEFPTTATFNLNINLCSILSLSSLVFSHSNRLIKTCTYATLLFMKYVHLWISLRNFHFRPAGKHERALLCP